MNEEQLKNIVKKSAVTTRPDFTDRVLSKIESAPVQRPTVRRWSLRTLIIGFCVVVILSGVLLLQLTQLQITALAVSSAFRPAIPLLWAFAVLVGFNYVLTVQKYYKRTGLDE